MTVQNSFPSYRLLGRVAQRWTAIVGPVLAAAGYSPRADVPRFITPGPTPALERHFAAPLGTLGTGWVILHFTPDPRRPQRLSVNLIRAVDATH